MPSVSNVGYIVNCRRPLVPHIYPIDDLKEHDLESTTCECNPEVKEINGDLFVIHWSYDGREAVEEANEILGNNTD